MTFQTWGQTPIVTTVSASPTPTSTVFTVASALDLVEQQYILVQVSGNLERVQIQDIAGNQITLASALSGVPDTPGAVKSGRELVKNTKLNAQALWEATDIADLKATDTTNMASNTRCYVKNQGISYLTSELTADELGVFDATTGSGAWALDTPSIDLVESLIQEYVTPLFTEIDQLRTEVDRLNALSVNTFETIFVRDTVYIAQLTTGTGTEITIQVAPTLLTELRSSDMVTLKSFPVPAGILVGGVSLQGGNISIKIWNPTAGSITPGFVPVIIKIERVSS